MVHGEALSADFTSTEIIISSICAKPESFNQKDI